MERACVGRIFGGGEAGGRVYSVVYARFEELGVVDGLMSCELEWLGVGRYIGDVEV